MYLFLICLEDNDFLFCFILGYLAANQCTASAMKLIDEMPKMTDYIPAKPANISEKGYLKHLLRSSVNRGLKDVLWDYGSSRILGNKR